MLEAVFKEELTGFLRGGVWKAGVGDVLEEAGQPRPGAELSVRTAGGRRFDSDPQPGHAHQESLGGKGGWGPAGRGAVGRGSVVAMLGGGDVRPCRCVRCPACCDDGPGAFLSSTCGHQVAHPCLCARLPVHVPHRHPWG